jgi:predicted regulator of Ras-like GTPase activity (Roadblock/LC7/MglB family)
MKALLETLDRVTQVAGVRGAMLVAESDGLVVAEALAEGLDGAAVAALAASLTLRLRRTAQGAGLTVPAVVQLRAEGGTLLTVPAGDDLLLVAVADREANLGLARLELKDAAARLAS